MTTQRFFSGFAALRVGDILLAICVASFSTPATAANERAVRTYTLPSVNLQRADGQSLPLGKALGDGRPVVLTFMFSSCQTVCPITNQVMTELEALLGPRRQQVHLISISIDPDHDTVRQLAKYAKETGHKGSFFTGDPAASEAVQRAFDTWRGDKMHHEPVFFLNKDASRHREWLRLNGLISPRTLLNELRTLAPRAFQDPPRPL